MLGAAKAPTRVLDCCWYIRRCRRPQPRAAVVSGSSIVSDQSLKLLHLSTRSCCRPPRTRRWPHPQCAITDGSDAVRIMFPQSNDRIFSSSRGTWTAVERGIGDENRAPPPLVQNAFRWAGGTRARRQRSTSSGYGFLARHGRKPGTAKKRAGWAARPDAREERG